jgi:hypothetical protein
MQTGLPQLADGRAEIDELPAQSFDFPGQRLITHAD